MEELPQDLGLALEDPSLKHDSDEQGYLSGSDMKIDVFRRRKMRKRRTTDTLFQVSMGNSANQLNNSPKSSSSVDEPTRNSRYVESYTGNCSEETDERPRQGTILRIGAMRTADRAHHKRVFKQARPCHCESDSYTENAPVYPRKQRKKKFRKIVVDSSESGLLPDRHGVKWSSPHEWKSRRKQQPHSTDSILRLKNLPPRSRNLGANHMVRNCDVCSSKACRNSLEQICNGDLRNAHSEDISLSKSDIDCNCICHIHMRKDDSSLSGSSCNSDTDSANFTPDDIGGDGDDELTDFCAESDSGPVLGIPHRSYFPWLALKNDKSSLKEERLWLCGMNQIKSSENMHCGNHVGSIVSNTYTRNDMARSAEKQNKYLKNVVRHSQRHKRRTKVKKSKVKSLKEQDLTQLNKLSLGNRNKRIKLDGMKNSNMAHNGQGECGSTTISYKDDVEMSEDGHHRGNSRGM